MTAPPAIFDRLGRRLRRDRAARCANHELEEHVAELLVDRLDLVTRSFERVLVINAGNGVLMRALRARGTAVDATDHGEVFARACGGTWTDEDRLPVVDGHYDLVVAPCGFDTVDDLPGALIAARRSLCPDGLFLACLAATPSLPTLRRVAAHADDRVGISAARLHPQIDVRAGGDLLVRAGFSLPVADIETSELSYPSLDRLVDDLRCAGATSVLTHRHAVGKRWFEAARNDFLKCAGPDGRTHETVSVMILTGWAPGPQQPSPARRGSATTSLAAALSGGR